MNSEKALSNPSISSGAAESTHAAALRGEAECPCRAFDPIADELTRLARRPRNTPRTAEALWNAIEEIDRLRNELCTRHAEQVDLLHAAVHGMSLLVYQAADGSPRFIDASCRDCVRALETLKRHGKLSDVLDEAPPASE